MQDLIEKGPASQFSWTLIAINCVYQVMFEEHVWNVFAVSLSD